MDEELLQLAHDYRQCKLWKKLNENQVFAVDLAGKKTIYLSILGILGEHIALSIYQDSKEVYQLKRVMESSQEPCFSPLHQQELFLDQAYLQVSFLNKEESDPEDVALIQAFRQAQGIRVRGPQTFPSIEVCRPNHLPWKPVAKKDLSVIKSALQASLDLALALEGLTQPERARLIPDLRKGQPIPLMKKGSQGYQIVTMVSQPTQGRTSVIRHQRLNELELARLKKLPKTADLQLDLVLTPEPIQEVSTQAPFFMYSLVGVDAASNYYFLTGLAKEYWNEATGMLNQLMKELVDYGSAPHRICVTDDRTAQLLHPLAAGLRIDCQIDPAACGLVRDFEEDLFQHSLSGDMDKRDLELEEWDLATFAEQLRILEEIGSPNALPRDIRSTILWQLYHALDSNIPIAFKQRIRHFLNQS
ncbi:DUF7309 domain-containing protein [Facklamia hominis]|uniref:DUF7309 domain-containing protein n=1 Tax=Facklamia hominis TaxID=178214 RepID=UPI000C7D8F1D|nr:hypothetical protein [Facklamia hominis]PKY93386.1 hypothetical protein CYJ56_02830 [Facklamia hominis]WPJ90548.1 hypothetical protein R0V13_08670 [Facklamia hominis]